jgi:hypothetical protein
LFETAWQEQVSRSAKRVEAVVVHKLAPRSTLVEKKIGTNRYPLRSCARLAGTIRGQLLVVGKPPIYYVDPFLDE